MGWLESTKRRYRKGNRGTRTKRATKDKRKGLLWGVPEPLSQRKQKSNGESSSHKMTIVHTKYGNVLA